MAQATTRRRSSSLGWISITLLVLFGAGAAVGTVLLVGGRLPWFGQVVAQDLTGKMAYPRAVRALEAFKAVRIEDLVEADGKTPYVVWLKPAEALEKGVLDATQVRGRVLSRDHARGMAFKEADLLPEGARESWTSAIPQGMRGMLLDEKQLPGLRGLKRGDHFDLIAAATVKAGPGAARDKLVPSDVKRRAAEDSAYGNSSRTLVQAAKVIVAIDETRGGVEKDQAGVAVPDAQTDDLLRALEQGVELSILALSSDPTAKAAPLPEPDRTEVQGVIRVVNGDKTTEVLVPAQPKVASPAPEGDDKR